MATGTRESQALQTPAGASDRPQPSLAEIYESEFDYVYRCLRALGVTADHTDDALQDVFMVVQQKLELFDGQAKLRTWLYAIVLRVARRYRERVAKEQRRFAPETDAPPAHDSADALDEGRREVFVLAHVEQLSAPEIAAITSLPLNTVYSRLRAARAAFAAQVSKMQRQKPRRQS
jgi:RNA polymerase sigma-70 factor (ECF subfamily)